MKAKKSRSYHHGNLRQTLIDSATDILRQEGIDGLSLRKLADKAGVSRTAPYHHFKDKNALLCAIAESGFVQWRQGTEAVVKDDSLSLQQRFRSFVKHYLEFAVTNSEIYELMFGGQIWKKAVDSDSLKQEAYPSFQYHVDVIGNWQQQGLLTPQVDSLRLAQVTWAALHGLARLIIDGVYTEQTNLDAMCDTLVALMISTSEH